MMRQHEERLNKKTSFLTVTSYMIEMRFQEKLADYKFKASIANVGQVLILPGTFNSSALELLGAIPELIDITELYDALVKKTPDGSTILLDRYQTGEVICGDHSAARDMFSVAHFYDSYSDYGLPIYLNFVIANSEPTPYQIGYWHRPSDEELKAEYITNIMRLAFSNPQIVGFGFAPFFFNNKCGNVSHLIDWSEVSPGRFEFQPKLAFFEVKRLLTEEWRTRGKAITDSDGRVSFRGFAGDYEVTVTLAEGTLVTQNLHVAQEGDNSFTIRLSASGLAPALLWSLVVICVLLLTGIAIYILILRRRS